MDQYGPDSDYEDGLKLRITDIDKRLTNLLKDVEAGNSSDIIRNRMIDLQNQKNLLEEELKIEEGRKKNGFSPRTVMKWLEYYLSNFNDPIMRTKILPFIIDKIMVDDDNLAINIFFSDERREENVESILAKIKAYEDYEQSIKNKKLDISDEEFVRMALGNVPDMDKAIDSLKGNSQNKDGANFFV